MTTSRAFALREGEEGEEKEGVPQQLKVAIHVSNAVADLHSTNEDQDAVSILSQRHLPSPVPLPGRDLQIEHRQADVHVSIGTRGCPLLPVGGTRRVRLMKRRSLEQHYQREVNRILGRPHPRQEGRLDDGQSHLLYTILTDLCTCLRSLVV